MAISLVELKGTPYSAEQSVDSGERCRVDAGASLPSGRGHGAKPSIRPRSSASPDRTPAGTVGSGSSPDRPTGAPTGARVLQVGCRLPSRPYRAVVEDGVAAWRWLLGEGCEVRTTAFIAPWPRRQSLEVLLEAGGGACSSRRRRLARRRVRRPPSSSPLAGTSPPGCFRPARSSFQPKPARLLDAGTAGPSSTATPMTQASPPLTSRNTMPTAAEECSSEPPHSPWQDVSSPSHIHPVVAVTATHETSAFRSTYGRCNSRWGTHVLHGL